VSNRRRHTDNKRNLTGVLVLAASAALAVALYAAIAHALT
jgi:hypothetical protein